MLDLSALRSLLFAQSSVIFFEAGLADELDVSLEGNAIGMVELAARHMHRLISFSLRPTSGPKMVRVHCVPWFSHLQLPGSL